MRKLILVVLLGFGFNSLSAATIPSQITYQGTLKQHGVPADGLIKMEFKIINADDSITYWNSGALSVPVTQGLFSQVLSPQNSTNPQNPLDWENTAPYIQVILNPDTTPVPMTPIEPITTSMFSLVAATVIDGAISEQKVANGAITQQKLAASIGTVPTGTVLPFAGPAAPSGYLLCDGSAVSRTTYSALFLAIGTVWGAGDGIASFNLPDLQGRTPIGAGQGVGLSNRILAAKLGEETHTLSIAEMPSHSHGINDPGHVHGPPSSGQTYYMQDPTSPFNVASFGGSSIRPVNATGSAQTGITIQNSGGGSAHNIMQPSIVVNYIIKT